MIGKFTFCKNSVCKIQFIGWLVGCWGFYGISTFVGYLMPNLFLSK